MNGLVHDDQPGGGGADDDDDNDDDELLFNGAKVYDMYAMYSM